MTQVEALLANLDHPRADDIRLLCTAMALQFPDLSGEIKWNAPSYKAGSTNIVTLRIQPPPNFQVILHVGSKKPASPPDLRFEIDGVRHTWADSARGIVFVDSADDIPPTIEAVRHWRDELSAHDLIRQEAP